MTRPYVPQDILDAAHARSAARSAQDWPEADRLRAVIMAAGWRVVDRGTDFSLEPEGPADVIDADGIRYGRSASVPSREAERSSARATLVLIASHNGLAIGAALEGVFATRTATDQVIVVDDAPGQEGAVRLTPGAGFDEIVRTARPLGAGASLNIALRRAAGEIVILLDGSLIPDGDIVARLAEAFADPSIAVVGSRGRRTVDLRQFEDIETDGDATTIAAGVLAFRRADGLAIGPADEALIDPAHLDTWWSLELREGSDESLAPRRARVVADLPVHPAADVTAHSTDVPTRARLRKRNFYRVLDRFRGRDDLLEPAGSD